MHVKHLSRLADRLEQSTLLATISQLTDQLRQSLTDDLTKQWLLDRQGEMTAHRRELFHTIRQVADVWTEASRIMALYERGCVGAQRCITGSYSSTLFLCITITDSYSSTLFYVLLL